METLFNYLEIPLKDLPSRGRFYSSQAKIEGRFLTVGDVKFLSLLMPENAEEIINSILKNCFRFTFLAFDGLLLCDREYLIFWLRANSYTNESGYSLKVGKCHSCGNSYTHSVDLEEVQTNQLDDFDPVVILPQSQRAVRIKLPNVASMKIKDDDKDFQLVARMIDCGTVDPKQYLSDFSTYDLAFLIDHCKSIKVGFDTHFNTVCPKCHATNEIEAELSDENMFTIHEMHDIIRMTTLITHNVGVQIPDTYSWPELETLQQVASEIIKNENDENSKAEAKAKAQAASMAAKHNVKNVHV